MESQEKRINYANFLERSSALFIDFTIILLPSFIFRFFQPFHVTAGIFFIIMDSFIGIIYVIYMHGRYGQTVGKKILSIKIFNTNNNEIIWKEAILRSIVDLIICLLFIILYVITVLRLSADEAFNLKEIYELSNIQFNNLLDGLNIVFFIWVISEVITMLFNKRRRAVHDFIAGTIVLFQKERKPGILKKVARVAILLFTSIIFFFTIFVSIKFDKNEVESLAAFGDNENIEYFVKTNKSNLNKKSIMGRNYLHYAAKEGNHYFCKLLIENNVDINEQDLSGNTPLHNAVGSGNIKLIKLLVENKADVFLKNSYNEKPCDVVSFLEDLSKVKAHLYEKGDKECAAVD
ncbi:MAG: RDD family protein [Candidatus Hodarchaeota archaeon]